MAKKKNTKEVIGHCELNFENTLPRLSRILIADTCFRNKGYGKLIVNKMLQKIFLERGFIAADLKGEVNEYTGASLPTWANDALSFPNDRTLLF